MGFTTFCDACCHNNCKDVRGGWGVVVRVGVLKCGLVDVDALLLQGSSSTLGVANGSSCGPAITIFRQLEPANCWIQLVIVDMR